MDVRLVHLNEALDVRLCLLSVHGGRILVAIWAHHHLLPQLLVLANSLNANSKEVHSGRRNDWLLEKIWRWGYRWR